MARLVWWSLVAFQLDACYAETPASSVRCDVPRVDGIGLTWQGFNSAGLRGKLALITGLLGSTSDSGPLWEREPFLSRFGAEAGRLYNRDNQRLGAISYSDFFKDDRNASDSQAMVMFDMENVEVPAIFSGKENAAQRETFHATARHVDKALGPLRARHIFTAARQGSEVPNNNHEESWLALLAGRKAWWLTDPSTELSEDAQAFDGWRHPCAALAAAEAGKQTPLGVVLCVQEAGEVLYFGNRANHATCNLDAFVLGAGGQGSIEEWPPVLQAVQRDDLSAVQELLAAGADVDTANERGRTGLSQAAYLGALPMLEHILSQGGDIETRDVQHQRQPMHRAAETGHLEAVKLLVARRAEVNAKLREGGEVLAVASENGHAHTVTFLAAQRANLLAVSGAEGDMALHVAANSGHVEVLKTLLNARADLHTDASYVSDNGYSMSTGSPLHRAARSGHLSAVEFLLANGADPRRPTGSLSPLRAALKSGQLNTFAHLASLQELGGEWPNAMLHRAIGAGHLAIVGHLCEVHGADARAVDDEGAEAVLRAAYRGHVEIIRYLAQRGARDSALTARDGDGLMSVQVAVEAGHLPVAQLLVDELGADPLSASLSEASHKAMIDWLTAAQQRRVAASVAANVRPNVGIEDDRNDL